MHLKIPKFVVKVLETIQKNNFEVYVVGGGIRDLLLEQTTYDWDFTTNAKPEEIQKIFPESFYDNKFGTVGITAGELAKQLKIKKYDWQEENINPEDVFEITTFRSESSYSDHRRPDEVSWGKNLKEDLQRRDFTINAMALRFKKTNDWEIIDPFKGQKDLEKRIIQTVGNPDERFYEDSLRMIRAIRIAGQLGFTIETKTLNAINKNSSLITKISIERVRDELFKLIKSDYPDDGIRLLFTSGLLQYIIPELIKMRGVQQAGHHTKDVWNHSLDSLVFCPSPDPIVRFAALIHDIGKPVVVKIKNGHPIFYNHEIVGAKISKKIADRLKFGKKDKDKLWLLVRYHMFNYNPQVTDKSIRKFIKNVGKENINDMMMLRIGDRKGGGSKATSWRLRELQERIGRLMYTPLQIKDLKVSGNDVMRVLKIKPGPKVGQVLQKLFDEVMEDDSNNEREYLLKRIKSLG